LILQNTFYSSKIAYDMRGRQMQIWLYKEFHYPKAAILLNNSASFIGLTT
jgi:hypothetical protein